ncbi:hypothetical protein D3C78_517810 [compost metagenome]
MNTEEAIGAGDNHLVHIAQSRQWLNDQLQLTTGIAFGPGIESAADRCLRADQLREALHGRHLDKAVDRDTAAELFAHLQQQARQQDGMATQIEKTVVGSDFRFGQAQQLAPQGPQTCFGGVARGQTLFGL